MRKTTSQIITILVAVTLATASQSGCSDRTTTATSTAIATNADLSTLADESTDKVGSEKTEQENVSVIVGPESAPSFGYEFESPVRLQAGGEFVSVESPGYACPTMADVDGDGKQDLVVGQFRNGNMQFYKNIAADNDHPPSLASADWLMTGEERAIVPGVW